MRTQPHTGLVNAIVLMPLILICYGLPFLTSRWTWELRGEALRWLEILTYVCLSLSVLAMLSGPGSVGAAVIVVGLAGAFVLWMCWFGRSEAVFLRMIPADVAVPRFASRQTLEEVLLHAACRSCGASLPSSNETACYECGKRFPTAAGGDSR
ncbi:MAG: hypothetical protein AAFU70_04310 [Planctomycetota bacterium]